MLRLPVRLKVASWVKSNVTPKLELAAILVYTPTVGKPLQTFQLAEPLARIELAAISEFCAPVAVPRPTSVRVHGKVIEQ